MVQAWLNSALCSVLLRKKKNQHRNPMTGQGAVCTVTSQQMDKSCPTREARKKSANFHSEVNYNSHSRFLFNSLRPFIFVSYRAGIKKRHSISLDNVLFLLFCVCVCMCALSRILLEVGRTEWGWSNDVCDISCL